MVCLNTSRATTKAFSTSFSLGVRLLDKHYRDPIHTIYGFVRFADEIVDTFHGHPQQELLERFRRDTAHAIHDRISLNPILHGFQATVHQFGIEQGLIDTFLQSMAMDLDRQKHDQGSFDRYVLGSAEVVGLMCLRVFCDGDTRRYEQLKPHAMSLGAAFQKVNFLRDLRQDNIDLGRAYFPGTDINGLTADRKMAIENDILKDFEHARKGIRQLPRGARMGVHLAYLYYWHLFKRIRAATPGDLFVRRVRVPDHRKVQLLVGTMVQHKLNLIR